MAHKNDTLDGESDIQLISRFIDKEVDASFEGLVECYVNFVYGTALRRTGDHGYAERMEFLTVSTILCHCLSVADEMSGGRLREGLNDDVKGKRLDAMTVLDR